MNNATNPFQQPGLEQAQAFWQDFFGKMGGMQPGPDAMERMRKAFMDSMSKWAEEYMRSEAFLGSMKQSMDASLAWQQKINEQLQKGLAAAQMPSREDTDQVTLLIRGMEDRLMDRLERITQRIEKLEKSKK
ncbi:MAG: hypothetical protein ACKVS9_09930 [Phycisphaerae bacterium]